MLCDDDGEAVNRGYLKSHLRFKPRRQRVKAGRRTIAIMVGAGLYLAAFFLPAANPFYGPADPSFPPWTGHTVFRAGWAHIVKWEKPEPFVGFQIVAVTSWMANPSIWLALGGALVGRWRLVRLFSGVGLILALLPLSIPRFADALAGQPGYWAWVGSVVFLFVVSWHERIRKDCKRAART